MRKTILFVLGMMMLGAGAVQANESPKERERSYEFRCRFLGSDVKKDSYGQCEAWGRVCRYNEDNNNGGPMALHDNHECRNRLAVACNGQPIYNDGAKHEDSREFEFLIGHGGSPVLKYPSKHPHDNSFVVSSWLKVNQSVLTGFCAFEKDRNGPNAQ
jgi:hypothetical protein